MEKATHVRVYIMPKAQKVSIEAAELGSEGTIFAVDQAAEVYQMMVKAAKLTKLPMNIYQPDPAGKNPVILYNRKSGAPYMALVVEVYGRNTATKKVVF